MCVRNYTFETNGLHMSLIIILFLKIGEQPSMNDSRSEF